MHKVFFIHGAYGDDTENWLPWLKKELEKLDSEVYIPRFPTPENQSLENWMNVFKNYEKHVDEDSIFVAHSIGPAFVLNLLEKLDKSVKACFFVAGFSELLGIPVDKINKTFVDKDFDWDKIREKCKYFYIYGSDNDPYVPLEKEKKFASALGTEVKVVKGAGHFNEDSGYIKFNLLLEDIESELGWYKGKRYDMISHSAGGIVINGNKICLMKDRDGKWYIPKGRSRGMENLLENAKREIWEETGIKESQLVKKLGVVKRPSTDNPNTLKLIDIFLFETSQDELNPQEEKTEAKWFEKNEAVKKLYTEEEKEFVKKS